MAAEEHPAGTNSVLVVSYYYPPYNSVGALRVSKFTQYLPEFGWRPVVLTAHNDYPATMPVPVPDADVYRTRQWDVNALPKRFVGRAKVTRSGFVTDRSTLKGRVLAAAGEVYRQVVNFPDGQIGWYPFALRAGRVALEHHPISVIYSSALPPTSHIVARRLARDTGLPWVAEFRDLWTDNHNLERTTILRSAERRLEDRVMADADAVVTVTEPWADLLRRRWKKPVHVITNGFDAADYPQDVTPPERFTLTYTGILYGRNQDVEPLLTALADLSRANVIDSSNFVLRLVGRYLDELQTLVDEMNLGDLVEISGTVPHEQALRMQVESHALLLLLWTGPEGAGWYPAKMFEYLGTGRPILGLGPRHNAGSRLIESFGAGETAETADEVAALLKRWIARRGSEDASRPAVVPEKLRRFERRMLTKELAELLGRYAGQAA